MKTVSINLYSFSELNDDAKNRAIDEHRDFMQSFLMNIKMNMVS